MRGLDPRIHQSFKRILVKPMDYRVKPGNDGLALLGLTWTYLGPSFFTAASKLTFADPGRSGFCWLACGAQPDSQITS
jgi:hypothetical protein